MANLNFTVAQTFPVGQVDIPFGAGGPTEITLDAAIPAPRAEFIIALGEQVTLDAAIPAPAATIEVFYDNAVARGPAGYMRGIWSDAVPLIGCASDAFTDSAAMQVAVCGDFQDGIHAAGLTAGRNRDLDHSESTVTALFTDGEGIGSCAGDAFNDLVKTLHCAGALFTDGIGASNSSEIEFRDLLRTERPTVLVRYSDGQQVSGCWSGSYQFARPLPSDWCGFFEDARHQTGRGGPIVIVPPPEPPPDACYFPPALPVALVFSEALTPIVGGPVPIPFICADKPPDPTVPVQTVYFVSNSVTLIRLPDLVEIEVYSLSITIDADSWAWVLQATLPASALPIVEPVNGNPRTLECTVNGVTWQFFAENLGQSRQFGQSRVTVSGRSRSAELAAPYAQVETRTITANRTAQQLVNDVLSINGQPIGWSVNWSLSDWLVTAGAWSHSGTYIQAVLDIAASVNAVVQSDPAQSEIFISPRYPILPWNWAAATPVATLPEGVITSESIQWADKPVYNRAFVSGESQGILADITRQGTAGNLQAPLVVNSLITHATAARQRGEAIFADTGRQALVTLSMPLDSAQGLPLFKPGELIEVSASQSWRGLVRQNSVTASGARVRQNVGIERQYL